MAAYLAKKVDFSVNEDGSVDVTFFPVDSAKDAIFTATLDPASLMDFYFGLDKFMKEVLDLSGDDE